MKIVALDPLELLETDQKRLCALGKVTLYKDVTKTQTEILQRIRDAELITANFVEISRAVIQQATSLKYIVVPGVGLDHIDVATAEPFGIRVVNCSIYNVVSVAEYTIGLMFAITRKIVDSYVSV